MTKIKSDVAYDIMSQFENKIEEADIPEATKDELYKSINDLIEDIEIMVEAVENEIDQTLYEFSDEYIEDMKDDIRTQDYLERSLFE